MRRLAAILSAVLLICFAESASAEKRVAFVVGNSSYQNVIALTNPANDAAAITEMFRKAAFDVVESKRDLKNTEMRRALRDFTEKARDADIAVIYYAGHGIEVDGTNYLIPVDAALERDTDAYDEAISLDRILQAIEPARQLRLVILDACRDNPFAKNMKRTVASRALGRGLAGVEPQRPNTLIAFAAKGGSTAADGDSRNSPFTTALLKHLAKPGLELGKAFRLVRDDVMNATGNRQEPFVYGSLGGNDVALVPAPAAPAPSGGNANADIRRDYELAERVGTTEAWDSFVAANPSGFYTDLAKAQRNKLAAENARIAATDKARGAAEEQARLAAEGAKASEQARAASQMKAAEEARLAAEKKKQFEDEKLAAAERARAAAQAKAAENERLAAEKARLAAEKKKQAEDAKLALAEREKAAAQAKAAEQAKKLEDIRIASAEQAKKGEMPKGEKPADQAVASLAPAGAVKSDSPPTQDIPRLLQAELRRVGCKTGDIDSEWNASARRALSSFNDNAKTKFDVKLASLDALDAVRAKEGRVCPLEKRPERVPKVAQRERKPASASGRRGGKCFVYNGTSFCE
jgi:caspase domain-containing protein